MSSDPAVILKPGKAKALQNRHPWVFSGAVAAWPESAEAGGLVRVLSHDGRFLGRGYLNRRSQISVRILTFDPQEAIDADFWLNRLDRAAALRGDIATTSETDMLRLIHAEGDGLPGLIVDRYGDWLAVQFLTLGMDSRKALLTELLDRRFQPAGIWERSDADVRRLEGLRSESGLLSGEPPPEHLVLQEEGIRFAVDIRKGHKTGFYLDQRENRLKVKRWFHSLGEGRLLNAFSYTGAFGICALAAGLSHVTHIDSSAAALELASENARINGFDPGSRTTAVSGDVFQVLRTFRDERRRFDAIVLDPPKLASNRGQILPASRGYKDLNLVAMQLLRPGGLLVTFSCSGLISPDLFQKILFASALDANRSVQILDWLNQAPDHPVPLYFPEAHYLKGFVCRVN